MTRGIIYITWPGDHRTQGALTRSMESVSRLHPELPIEVIQLPDGSSLLEKADMADFSKFDTTLYLDADTVVLERLDFGFTRAELHGLACCICECPWARRYAGLRDAGDLIEYNTGVLFFTKGSSEVFRAWKRLVGIDSSIRFLTAEGPATMPCNDQAGFAAAIDETGFSPFVLPMNWNFRPIWQKTAFGPVKIWHDYSPVPDGLRKWNYEQSSSDAIINIGRVAQ